MTRSRSTAQGVPTDLNAEYYAQRASMALIISEGTQPSDDGQGKTKRGKGTKIMAIAAGNSVPLAVTIDSASPHESKLVDETLTGSFPDELPEKLIGDKAHDSDALDRHLDEEYGIEMIAPNRENRSKTQDGRALRRYLRRWVVERLFAWLHWFRRLVVRYEFHAENFLGMVRLGCMKIVLRYL